MTINCWRQSERAGQGMSENIRHDQICLERAGECQAGLKLVREG